MRRDISERHRDRARVLVRKILDLDTVSNRGVVAACASQISSFIIHIWHIIIHICHIIIHMCHIIIHKFRRSSCSHRRAESVNVLAHPRKKGNVVHASEAPHQTDVSRTKRPATSLLHLFTCFLQTASYVSPE